MKFTATARSVQGSSASRRLRRAGRVPAIVYGGSAAPLNIELDHNEIYHALRKEEFHASILQMQLEGAKDEQVLLRSVQWHAYKPQVLHVDFQRVDANQALRTKVISNTDRFVDEFVTRLAEIHGQNTAPGKNKHDKHEAALAQGADLDLANAQAAGSA